ncbi:MAG: ornithine carbamoyltransferase [Corynebacterium sp.]|nr:ornithine carbamoyltransferase [Corynebacterium sp.]
MSNTTHVGLPRVRHYLRDDDLTREELAEVMALAAEVKKNPYAYDTFAGPQSVAMLFDKTSTRTRFSFATAIAQLKGTPISADTGKTQLGKGETYQDTGAVLSRFCSAIVWRTGAHQNLLDMAETATVPIVNALCDDFHPCQILADLQTIIENTPHDPATILDAVAGKKAVFLGDGANNMANSYLLGLTTAGMEVAICAPEGFHPQEEIVTAARQRGTVTVSSDLAVVDGADVVITDTWVSMGQENDGIDRAHVFQDYQVNAEVMARANPDAIFLHCLPAYRGSEVTAEVIDGPQSRVFDEAENRLHAQKALLIWLMAHQEAADDDE